MVNRARILLKNAKNKFLALGLSIHFEDVLEIDPPHFFNLLLILSLFVILICYICLSCTSESI